MPKLHIPVPYPEEEVIRPYGWLMEIGPKMYGDGWELRVQLKPSGAPVEDEWDLRHDYLETAEKLVKVLRENGFHLRHPPEITFEGDYKYRVDTGDKAHFVDGGAKARIVIG